MSAQPIAHPDAPAVASRVHRVDIAGSPARYWSYGPPDAATTIVAVHGFRGDHHGLEPVVSYLPEFRVLSPDLPGFGETDPVPTRRHDLDFYRDWVTEFVDTVAPGSVLLGHSFGSIVTSAAVSGGLSVHRLILINPIGAPALAGPRGILTRLAVGYYWLGARLPRRIGEWLLRLPVIVRVMSVAMVKTSDPRLRKFVHSQHDAYFSGFADRDVLHEAFLASVSHDVREFADGIRVPTLIVAAERDDITSIEDARALAVQFQRVQLSEIANVGHLIHYETPRSAATAIRVFVSESNN